MKINYPSQIVTWKGKLAYLYQWNMYLMDLGRGQVVGKVTQVFSELTTFMVVLKFFGFTNMSMGQILLFSIIIGIIGVWIFGALYAYLRMDIVQQLVVSERNPLLTEIHKQVTGGAKDNRKTKTKTDKQRI
jgi:hypothetical protein